MGKAITGAIEIAAGVALEFVPGGQAFGTSLILSGVGTELSAIADALQSQRGTAITVRQAAAPRRVIYGCQRVGAVEVFESTTGGSKSQYNMALVFSSEKITSYVNLYLDGRRCYWAGSGAGYTVRDGIGFGGGCDGQDHIGPDGSKYNFANASSGSQGVFVDPRFGDQAAGDYSTALQANDSRWGPDGQGNTPSLMGCAYIYLKVEYNTDVFPNKPEVRATIKGKPVYDPRTGLTAYSENWALIVADVITNSEYGLGDAVNTDSLIAAANVCEESVVFSGSGGGTEARYTCHYTWSLDKSAGDVLNELMQGAGGRLSYIEGEWHIFPGTYYGPVASFSSAQLIATPTWSAQRRFREKTNRVQGTYLAPSYPYSVAGNLYDSNGYYNGQTQNNYPFAFQPTSYPTFACDTQHGYASDQYLAEDGGIELPLNMDFASCLSVTQAQRLAKIALLRNRQQGSGTLTFGPEALVLQPGDTFLFTMPQRGWSSKLLEVSRLDISIVANADGVPEIQVQLSVNETDPSVYTWYATDELTPYDVEPAAANGGRYETAPPTNLQLSSSSATALVQPDGTVVPRIELQWNTPADIRVTSIQIQYELVGATSWSDGGTVSVASNTAYIPATAGQQYNVRIRSLRASGGSSTWVEVDGVTAGLVMNLATQDGVGIGSLIGIANPDGTASIECTPFTAPVGNLSLSIFPGGPVTITGLLPQKLYYIYYQDPTYAGGNVTPVATLNKADFAGKLGYFLIDSIVTPYASATGSTTRYSPGTSSSFGNRTVQNEGNAYDGNLDTFAYVSASAVQTTTKPATSTCDCTWSGFPATVLSADATLSVVADAEMSTSGSATISATVNGTSSTLTTNPAATQTTYTLTIPAGTNLSTVYVSVRAAANTSGEGDAEGAGVDVYEIYIQ